MPAGAGVEQFVKTAARDLGFDLCGVAPVGASPELDYFPGWIERGYAGEMAYLAARNDEGQLKRSAIARAAPWARSVIVCALNYNSAAPNSTDPADPTRGWISRYAWGGPEKLADYHDVVLRRLRDLESRLVQHHGGELRTWCYVDTGPVVERVAAKYAGIGWIGKNTCIINDQTGSWLFLGVILTSIDLTPDLPAPDRCGTCTRCLDACPTNAFLGPYQLDATRCISYLTIEKRGAIPEELRSGMGRHVFGCDICQDVCPWNSKEGNAPVSALPEFQPRPPLVNPALDWLAQMSQEEFAATFRGSPIKRSKRTGLRRNAAIAMGNSGNRDFLPLLEQLQEDDDPIVAEHAAWACERLRSGT